jgi:hypothetical protein
VDRRVSAAFELTHANLHIVQSITELVRPVNMSRCGFCHVSNTEVPFSVRRVISAGFRLRSAIRVTFLALRNLIH